MAAQALLRLRSPTHRAVPPISSSLNSAIPRSRQSVSTTQSQSSQTGCCCCCCSLTTVSGNRRRSQQRLLQFHVNAVQGAILGVEPDLPEPSDYIEGSEWKTAGEDTQETDFAYGKADGHHTWHEGDDNVEFIDAMSTMIKEAGGPNDHPGQATISWLYLPVIFSGLAFGIQPEYLFLVAVLFIFAFIGIEMTKPDKPSNFEYDSNFPGRGYKVK